MKVHKMKRWWPHPPWGKRKEEQNNNKKKKEKKLAFKKKNKGGCIWKGLTTFSMGKQKLKRKETKHNKPHSPSKRRKK